MPLRPPSKRKGARKQARGLAAPKPRRNRKAAAAKARSIAVTEMAELEDLRRELERVGGTAPARWNAEPDDVQRSVARLVLTLVEFIRRLLERQAIRRME